MNHPTSPRKMRYVADTVRGKDVNRALDILQHSAKVGAKPMYKLLLSAIDNWSKKNEGLRIEDAQLIVKTVYVDGGTVLKRWLNAPHGRAFKMRKRSNHITIVVDSKVLMAEKPKPEEEITEDVAADVPTIESVAEETAAEKPAKKAAKRKSKKEKEVAAQ